MKKTSPDNKDLANSSPALFTQRYSKPIGFTLMAFSVITWLVVLSIPFLGFELLAMAGIMTALVIFAELCFFVAILFLGKPFWNKIKQNLMDKLNQEKMKK